MGRVQDSSESKMNGKQRIQGDGSPEAHMSGAKKRKGGQESSGADATPSKDRRAWSQKEETELVKMLVEHRAEGRSIPFTSRSATYWSELMTLLYPGDKGVTQRRLSDKVRRMLQRYGEIRDSLHEKKEIAWKNPHEKALFDSWEKIFGDQTIPTNGNKSSASGAKTPAPSTKVSNAIPVKVVEDSSSEEVEDDEEHGTPPRASAPSAKAGAPPALRERAHVHAPASESDEEEEEDEDDEDEDDEDEEESSPEKRRPVGPGHNGFQGVRSPQGEMPKTPSSSLPREQVLHRSIQSGGGMGAKEKSVGKDRQQQSMANGSKRRAIDEGALDDGVIKALKSELFEYVHKLREDCMRELDEVKSQLMSPARVQLARKRQELFMEELALQEKELEITRRYCRLQKDALKLQNSS
ncbi:hypothetical protein R1flu_012775 [Riccia fluitans]|uniref:Glabrous enhancer-binding protein-like DBD domain-containing protein n=1 Tax=Riccia fluitans TaxID=41844 RepID=A0ABD1ZBU2_9MARC